jgi:hypothetical protein
MTTKELGQEGFRWFIGVVEDREDPEKIGRVRVRIYNVHGDSAQAPTATLPWASVLMPLYSSSLKSVGVSATGLQIGSTVVGFFLDGNETNMPIIFGALPGKGDMTQLATGTQTLIKQQLPMEPGSAYNARYPYNKVFQTEAGHVTEMDDTPGSERLHTFHTSGSYEEINSNGRRVVKTVEDSFDITQKNKTIYVGGDVEIRVKGNYTLTADGTIKIKGSKIILNDGTNGAARVGDTADTGDAGDAVGSNQIETGSSTVLIGD